jgi:hypothetical protein
VPFHLNFPRFMPIFVAGQLFLTAGYSDDLVTILQALF